MRKILVSMFVVAVLVALAIPTMAATLKTTSVNGKAVVTLTEGDTELYRGEFTGNVKTRLDGTTLFVNDKQVYPPCITVTFPGVEGVTLEYYPVGGPWQKVAGIFNEEGTIELASGTYIIRAVKGGSFYVFPSMPIKESCTLNVPVATITVRGVNSACNLGISQNDWVYNMAPAKVGEANVFNVFDNDKTYKVVVGRTGYNHVEFTGYNAGAEVWLDVFYNIPIPEGVTNIRISNASWVDTAAWYANYLSSYVFTLMKNNKTATLHFTFGGINYVGDFILDGSNPFDNVFGETIEITQTVIGGSYGFVPQPLCGAGYTYEIVVSGGLAIVAAPDAWANANMFVFNQAAGTSVSRAGTYVITASQGGLLVKIFTFNVK